MAPHAHHSLRSRTFLKGLLAIPLAVGALALPSPSKAVVVFQDSFNANTTALGTDNNNPVTPLGWSVTNGTIDIVSSSFYGPWSGHGIYIDLDGSSRTAGRLAKTLSLTGGVKYTLSFDLAGSYHTDTPPLNSVTVSFGSFSTTVADIPRYQDFTTYAYNYTPLTTGNFDLSFLDLGNDNQGAFLDNVNVTVAAPGPLPLLGTAIAFRFSRGLRRRSRKF
jgi:hypothetical protein